ncbi:hypothetical protein ACFOW3_02630 [Acidovorax facilis]|uniref:Uncharacterized protein n=1 Tax=Acidovorax facilis TaxID=12917 RepID=A0ABV8D4Q2_9BURK
MLVPASCGIAWGVKIWFRFLLQMLLAIKNIASFPESLNWCAVIWGEGMGLVQGIVLGIA